MNLNSLMIPVGLGLSALAFGSSPALAQAPSLGSAQSFAVLGASTVTSTGATTVTGDLGVSPGTAVTGFPPGILTGTLHAGDAVALQAQADVTVAYNACAGAVVTTTLTGQDLGGQTLTPGVYFFAASAPMNGVLTLDAQGNPNAVFIFQIGSTLLPAINASVNVINGAQNGNVFWQVGSSATLAAGVVFRGNILALASITLGAGTQVHGRALARTGAVTMGASTVNSGGLPPTPSWVPFGSGCMGSNGVPVLQLGSLPAMGGTFSLGVQNLGSSYAYMVTGLGLLPRALPLSWGFAANCTLHVDAADLIDYLPQALGNATWSLAIPNIAALAGLHLYNQVAEFGATSAVSNAGDGVIQ
jgi:type VI secretion system secreted protein VgrG